MNYYNDYQNELIAKQEYTGYGLGDPVKIGDKRETIGYVSDIINDTTGQNAFVITDKPVGAAKSAVQNVTVLYRGSSFNLSADAKKDWIDNDIPAAVRTIGNLHQSPTPQLVASGKTLTNMMNKYPNAQFDVYGHSLGSMDGQYAVSNLSDQHQKRLSGAYFYEGPNVYNMLNDRQRATAQALNKQNKIFNYVDTNDLVPLGYGKNKKTVGIYVKILSKKLGDPVNQHMWGGYRFDDNGNIVVNPSVSSEYANILTSKKISKIKALKTKMISGGTLSAGQEQLLDEYEALARVEGMQVLVDSQMGHLQMVYEEGIDEARALWRLALMEADMIGKNLSEYEQESALDAGGVTEEIIKSKPIDEYKQSISKIKTIQKEYEELHRKIKNAIDHQVQSDTELAGEIKGMLW